MADVAWGRRRWIAGARVESNSQLLATFDLFNRNTATTVQTRLQNSDWLPAINAVYRLGANTNLRGSFSRTLNRPEFRELSTFEFTDVVGGRSVVGNPDLERATIENYDLRGEWFPSGEELVSVSFFRKRFQSPIERVIQPTAQLRTSFVNADGAENTGFEVDFRRNLGFLSSALTPISVSTNYTFVDSRIDILPDEVNVLTSLQRPLAGQSRRHRPIRTRGGVVVRSKHRPQTRHLLKDRRSGLSAGRFDHPDGRRRRQRSSFSQTSFQFTIVDSVVPVTDNITSDTTWTANSAYLLDDVAVFVQDGATLTIEAGAYVLGLNLGTLVVARGARMVAVGTAARPIVMTSALSVGERGPANRGGLILNGRAPVNPPGGVGIPPGEAVVRVLIRLGKPNGGAALASRTASAAARPENHGREGLVGRPS